MNSMVNLVPCKAAGSVLMVQERSVLKTKCKLFL